MESVPLSCPQVGLGLCLQPKSSLPCRQHPKNGHHGNTEQALEASQGDTVAEPRQVSHPLPELLAHPRLSTPGHLHQDPPG